MVLGWLIKFAVENLFQFISFQSVCGQELLKVKGFMTRQLDIVMHVDDNGAKTHSDGFLKNSF